MTSSGPDIRASQTPFRPVAPYEYRYGAARRPVGRRLRRAVRSLAGTLLVVLVAAGLVYAALVYFDLLGQATVIGVENVISVEEEILNRGP